MRIMINTTSIYKKGARAAAMLLTLSLSASCVLTSCQDKDIDIADMKIAAPDVSQVQGELNGYDYTITWPQPEAGKTMNVALYRGGSMISGSTPQQTNSYTIQQVETGDEYWFVLRLSDGENQSEGSVVTYTRPGASKVKGLSMAQVEKADATNRLDIKWDAVSDAENYELIATNGKTTVKETLPASTTTKSIDPVSFGDTWEVSVTATNKEGKAIPQTAALLIGKTKYAFLSQYKTPEELIANGDDDEASAWLWFNATQPQDKIKFIYFGDIKTAQDIEPYRMMFWMRDIETDKEDDVWNMPSCAEAAAPVIGQWVKDGGNLLLWSHAVPYIGTIGRLDTNLLKSVGKTFGCGIGGGNGDTWKMGASINTGSFSKDYTTHPVYKGLTTERNGEGIALLPCKGPGWTEDHNCLFFDIPEKLTGLPNNSKECYDALTTEYGIYPLGTWDSQAKWVSQLNVWEATKGTKVDYNGTILCIGNGGLEFSMKNADGTPDKSANPKNNAEQANVLKFAQNCIDYLMSK